MQQCRHVVCNTRSCHETQATCNAGAFIVAEGGPSPLSARFRRSFGGRTALPAVGTPPDQCKHAQGAKASERPALPGHPSRACCRLQGLTSAMAASRLDTTSRVCPGGM